MSEATAPLSATAAPESAMYGHDVASIYDNDSWGIYNAAYDDVLAMLPRDAEFRRVLDIGVGTGTVLSRVASAFRPQTLYGLDPAPAMLERAREKVPGLEGVLGTDDNLVDDARFRDLDLVLANFVLAYSGPSKLFSRVHKTLRPGGTFAVATTTMRSFQELLRIGYHPIFKLISLGYDISTDDLQRHLPPVPADEEALCAELRRAGFEIVSVRTRRHAIEFKDGRSVYEFGLEGGWWLDLYARLNVTPRSVHWINIAMRACQLFGLLARPCRTSMEVSTVIARRTAG